MYKVHTDGGDRLKADNNAEMDVEIFLIKDQTQSQYDCPLYPVGNSQQLCNYQIPVVAGGGDTFPISVN